MNFRINIIAFAVLFLALIQNLKAQEDINTILDEIIEEIAASSDDVEYDYTNMFSTLENLYYNPINLNSATKEQLEDLIFLTDFQIYSIINYRKKYGDYLTIYELQFVDDIDILTLKYMLNFVTVAPVTADSSIDKKKINNMFSYGKHTVLTRYQRTLQEKAGYKIPDSIIAINPDKSRYSGSPDKIYLRYGYQYKTQLSYGFTAEKDDGEQFFRGAQKYGFDFYSAHFQINDIGPLKKLIIGDYSAEFGQGLTLWSGMTFGKTSSIMNVMKKSRGINKYTSVNESAFFRGQAATFAFGNFTVTEFFSYKNLDGSVEIVTDSIGNEEEYITNFNESGYHRTPSEIAKRNSIQELVTGGNVSWKTSKLNLGLTGVYYNYSNPFTGNQRPYTYFDFAGKSNFNLGLNYLYNIQKVNFFGETSISENLGFATINGAVIDFVPEFKMSVVQRYYQSDYQALYAQPFSAGNKPNNESGIFVGAEIFPIKRWKINAYIDSWKYPWLRYGVNSPSTGMDYLLQISYFPNRNLDMYARIKHQTKSKNNSEVANGVAPLSEYSNTKLRYHINYSVSNNLKLKSHIELANYNTEVKDKWGYLVYQDIQYKPTQIPLVFTLRFAIFDTEDYDTRIYAYEPDVLYGFSVPAYYSQGTRIVFVVKYEILERLNLWFRIANTYYQYGDNIGSGLDLIEGKNKTDIKLQLQYKF